MFHAAAQAHGTRMEHICMSFCGGLAMLVS
jgi:hypothetical protein